MRKHNDDIQSVLADVNISDGLREQMQNILAAWGTEKEGEVRRLTRQVNFKLVIDNFEHMATMFEQGGIKFEKVTAQYNAMVEGILDGTQEMTEKVQEKLDRYHELELENAQDRVNRANKMNTKASVYETTGQLAKKAFIERPGIRTADETRLHTEGSRWQGTTGASESASRAAEAFNNQFQNTKLLFDANRASTQELAAAMNKAHEAAIQAGEFGFKQLGESLRMGFTYSQQDYMRDMKSIWSEFATDMRTGTAKAFGEAIRGAKDLEEAFGDMFKNMADKMLDKSLQMAVDSVFDAILGMKKGGEVKGYASGGMVKGGSGTKDDVPAYLSRGEYVIRKSAVNAYGKQFFEALNSSSVVTAAGGGAIAVLENEKKKKINNV